MEFADLPGEAIMHIARLTPHPCAKIMEDFYRSDEWFDWLEKFEFQRERAFMLALEEGYAREEERRAKRARLDMSAILRAEAEEEAAKYGLFLD